MTTTLVINGRAIIDIPSFYDEINRVFMSGEDWRLGQSLDALDDLLHGGYGAISGRDAVTLIWTDMEASRLNLGVDTTKLFLQEKLRSPHLYNSQLVSEQFDKLEQGVGQTFFDIVLRIFADHPNFTLMAQATGPALFDDQ